MSKNDIAHFADDLKLLPNFFPELLTVIHRPLPQLGVLDIGSRGNNARLFSKLGHLRLCNRGFTRLPKRSCHLSNDLMLAPYFNERRYSFFNLFRSVTCRNLHSNTSLSARHHWEAKANDVNTFA